MIQRPFAPLVCATAVTALAACSSTPLRGDPYGSAAPAYPQQPYPQQQYPQQPYPQQQYPQQPISQPAPAYPQQTPAYGQAPTAQAQYGTVRTIDVVPVASRPSGAGAVLGAVVGAVVGNQIGSGSGRAAATVAGAVGGGLAGNAIEGRTRRDSEVYRVAVRFDDGTYREFDFQRVDDLRVGDRIRWDGSQFQRL